MNLDSLMGVWNDKTQADTIRMEALNKFIWEPMMLDDKLDSGEVLSQLIYDLAIKTGSRKYEVIGLNNLGACQALRGNIPMAIERFEQGLKIAEEIGYPRGIFESLQSLGVTYGAFLNDIPKGETYLSRSLKVAEESNNKEGMAKAFTAYGKDAHRQNKILEAREYYFKALKLGLETENKGLAYTINQYLAGTYAVEGNYAKAIDYLTIALQQAEAHGNHHQSSHILTAFGGIYLSLEDYSKSVEYFSRALDLMDELNHRETAGILMGIGGAYAKQKNYPKAMEYFFSALKVSEELVKEMGVVGKYSLGGSFVSLAYCYYESGDYKNALDYAMRGLKIGEELGMINAEPYAIIGNTYRKSGQFTKAITWCNKSLTVAEKNLYIEGQREACECLYQSYKSTNQDSKALIFHERFTLFKDSLNKNETGKKLQRMEFSKQMLADSLEQQKDKMEVQMAHETEIHQKNNTRNIFLGSGIMLFVLSGGLWSRLNFTRKSKAVLQIEKDRSESLLLNILPAEVAEELKQNGEALARDFDMVSIIFTDFKGFTETSGNLSAGELVGELNYCFKGFDAIMEKYGIEKIKTIGDAYMAAGGLQGSKEDAAIRTVRAALEMQEFISKRKAAQDASGLMAFEMRAGIHTGPVVAGIVGVKKFQYDIWGDTVNTASRMESNSEVGRVNISQSTYEEIKDESDFTFEKREKIQVKGKGEMEMYFVLHPVS